jgi:hypothetical protein
MLKQREMKKETYSIGQVFVGHYPPKEAIAWCNLNNCRIVADGFDFIITANPEPTNEELLLTYENKIQAIIDATAKSKGYDNSYTCLSYLNSKNTTWKTEAETFLDWRDSVWEKCHELLNAYNEGKLKKLTIEQIIAELPKITW